MLQMLVIMCMSMTIDQYYHTHTFCIMYAVNDDGVCVMILTILGARDVVLVREMIFDK